VGPAALSGSDFVWLIGSLCQINRLPFDAALLVQRFPAPHSTCQSIEALQSLGFRTGEADVARAALPCIAFLRGEMPRAAIVVRCEAGQALYFAAGSQTAERAPLERFEPKVVVARHD